VCIVFGAGELRRDRELLEILLTFFGGSLFPASRPPSVAAELFGVVPQPTSVIAELLFTARATLSNSLTYSNTSVDNNSPRLPHTPKISRPPCPNLHSASRSSQRSMRAQQSYLQTTLQMRDNIQHKAPYVSPPYTNASKAVANTPTVHPPTPPSPPSPNPPTPQKCHRQLILIFLHNLPQTYETHAPNYPSDRHLRLQNVSLRFESTLRRAI